MKKLNETDLSNDTKQKFSIANAIATTENYTYLIRSVMIDYDLDDVYEMGVDIFQWNTEKTQWRLDSLWDYTIKFPELFLVAEVESISKIAGFAIGCFIDDIGYFDWIAVGTPYRKQGLGTKLMKKIIDGLKNEKVKKIWADFRDTPPALALARKGGFKASQEIKVGMEIKLI